ncbi:MAG: cupredoxin domain-containing protein [Acidimicrobiales bacterium]
MNLHAAARRALPAAMLAGAAAVGVLACSTSSDTASSGDQAQTSTTSTSAAPVNQGATVVAKEFAFDPTPEQIKAGQTVTWKNEGNSTHQVGAVVDPATGQRLFSSEPLRPGDSYVFSFAQPGTYNYICVIHPDRMQAQVVVAP